MTPFANGWPLAHVMERFPDLHKAEFVVARDPPSILLPGGVQVEGLAARCTVVHEGGLNGVVHFVEVPQGDDAEGLWRLVSCDVGCSPREAWEAAEVIDQRQPGEDAPEAEAPKGNLFTRAHVQFSETELLEDPPPLKFIVWPYVPAETVSILAGPGGSNKTTLMLYAAVCRALKRQMFKGVLPEEGETVILTTEDQLSDYRRKLAALREYMGADFDAKLVAERLHFFDLSGAPVRLIAADRGEQFVPTAHVEWLVEALKAKAPRADWLIAETVSRLAGGVENNASHSILVEAMQRVCRTAHVASTLVTHVSQDAARNGTADAYSARGGSALGDNGRASMVLTRLNENNREEFAKGFELAPEDLQRTLVWTLPKANGVAPQPARLLWRETTKFGPVLNDAELVPLAAGSNKATMRPGRKPQRTFVEIKFAIIECIKNAAVPINMSGVVARIGGTRGQVLQAGRELIEGGFMLDGKLGLEVVRNYIEPIRTDSNLEPK